MLSPKHHPIVGLTFNLGLIMIAFAIIVLIFAQEQAWVLVPVVITLAVMGIVFAYFATKKR